MGGEFRRGSGPNALPQGGASQVNRSQPDEADFMTENTEIPVVFASGEDEIDDVDGGMTENMQVLASSPDREYRASLTQPAREPRLPKYVLRHLPTLAAAAKDPDAPATIRAMYNAVVRQLGAEVRRGG